MKTKKKNVGKNRFALPLGIIASVLAAAGLITTIRFFATSVRNLTDDVAEKRKYEKILAPAIMFDPDPFDDLTQANVSQLLNGAVWALLMNDEGAEKYPYTEGETFGIVVPQEDIEKYFVSLFGTEIDIASLHSSIDMSEYEITYDAALKSYILPITGVESAYTPKVYDIKKRGGSLVLTVGYIGNKAWAQIADGEYVAPEPDKYMKITMRERSGGMYVSSIQAADAQEAAASLPELRTTRAVPANVPAAAPTFENPPSDGTSVEEISEESGAASEERKDGESGGETATKKETGE